MLPSGGGPSKVTTENFTAGNIKTGVTIIVKYRGKDLYKVLGTFTNDANATAADILNTKTAYVNGNKVTGSMPNIGAVSQSLAINGTYNVPKGYHNGSGRVTQSIPTQGAKTITPNTGDQRVTAGRYLTGDITVKGDGNLVAGNIKSGISIFGVWGNVVSGRYAVASVGYGRVLSWEVGDENHPYLQVAGSSGWADSAYGVLGQTGIHGYGFISESAIKWQCTKAGNYTIQPYGQGTMNKQGDQYISSGEWITMQFAETGDIYWRDTKSGGFCIWYRP